MSTINIDLATAKSIASLINIASKPKSGTPVLEQVRCTLFSDGKLVAVATDRYAIVTAGYDIDNPSGETREFGISHDVAKFITGVKAPQGGIYVEIEFDQYGIKLSVAGQTFSAGSGDSSNYPPVAEMVAKWQHGTEAMPVTLSLTLLSRLTKVIDRSGKKLENWSIELGKDGTATKPAPIRLLADGFSAIQQPRLAR